MKISSGYVLIQNNILNCNDSSILAKSRYIDNLQAFTIEHIKNERHNVYNYQIKEVEFVLYANISTYDLYEKKRKG